uniref:Uncharacterized protein n=1 Tax=Glossina pallidipes TaxID=7398 RepID=A0A1A9ZKC0_GLOPL
MNMDLEISVYFRDKVPYGKNSFLVLFTAKLMIVLSGTINGENWVRLFSLVMGMVAVVAVMLAMLLMLKIVLYTTPQVVVKDLFSIYIDSVCHLEHKENLKIVKEPCSSAHKT